VKQASADVIANTDTENIMDYMGVRLNSVKAIEAGLAMSFNIVHEDIDQVLYSEVSNGNLVTVVVEAPIKTADATLLINKSDLGRLMGEQVSMAELLEAGCASLEGDKSFLQKLMPVFDDFSDTFEIMPLASKDDTGS
jgi:alkyl sulfatase BDS1-like metallo-beta-lactamase superfamily hydrolase